MMNAAQIRAARAIVKENQKEFAEHCSISLPLLKSIELEEAGVTLKTAEKVSRYIEANNYEFTDDGGLRPISNQIKVYTGRKGFIDFIKDVYTTVAVSGGNIYVDNVNEDQFEQWLKDEAPHHRKRMAALNNFKFKILVKEGDSNTVAAEYAEYRSVDQSKFSKITYYMYGNKHATIIFEDNDVRIYVTNDKKLTDIHKEEFEHSWTLAGEVNES